MITVRGYDLVMQAPRGKVVQHPHVNQSKVETCYGANIPQGMYWVEPDPMKTVNYRTLATDRSVGQSEAVRPHIGFPRVIRFNDASDIGFDVGKLVCVCEVWMHVDLYPLVLQRINDWRVREANFGRVATYPKVPLVRQLHTQAVIDLRFKLSQHRVRTVQNRAGFVGDTMDIQSIDNRFWRIISADLADLDQFRSRTWHNGYAPAKKDRR